MPKTKAKPISCEACEGNTLTRKRRLTLSALPQASWRGKRSTFTALHSIIATSADISCRLPPAKPRSNAASHEPSSSFLGPRARCPAHPQILRKSRYIEWLCRSETCDRDAAAAFAVAGAGVAARGGVIFSAVPGEGRAADRVGDAVPPDDGAVAGGGGTRGQA